MGVMEFSENPSFIPIGFSDAELEPYRTKPVLTSEQSDALVFLQNTRERWYSLANRLENLDALDDLFEAIQDLHSRDPKELEALEAKLEGFDLLILGQ